AEAKPTAEQLDFFEKKIRPVLSEKCYKCHSEKADKVKGGLVLDTREGTRRGGDSGPAVVPGNLDDSILIQAVRYTNKDFAMLLRRIYFDLTGLPPSPLDVGQFFADWKAASANPQTAAAQQQAVLGKWVDKLLASPQFGERWGRHWLDVARYAESSGKDVNIAFPYAWRYRDYVIDAVNADVAFHRFLLEQLAGDLLPHDVPAWRARLVLATGFL